MLVTFVSLLTIFYLINQEVIEFAALVGEGEIRLGNRLQGNNCYAAFLYYLLLLPCHKPIFSIITYYLFYYLIIIKK